MGAHRHSSNIDISNNKKNCIHLHDIPASFSGERARKTALFPLDTALFEAVPVRLLFASTSGPQIASASRLQNALSPGMAIRLTHVERLMYTPCPRCTCE